MKSLLFVPGNNPAMLQNADVFDADIIIIDLEDAVSVEEKDAARILVSEFLEVSTYNDKILIRVNGMDTPFFEEDMKSLSGKNILGVMLPKINLDVLKEFTSKYDYDLYPIIESCIAVTHISEIIKDDNIKGLLLGAEDLTSDLGVQRTKEGLEILMPRQLIAYYASAYKKIAIDTPSTSINNDDELKLECKTVKNLGFKAKACIHPNQVQIVNNVFSVTIEEYVWGQRVLKAAEEQSARAFSFEGQMIDEPVIKRARMFVKEGATIYGE